MPKMISDVPAEIGDYTRQWGATTFKKSKLAFHPTKVNRIKVVRDGEVVKVSRVTKSKARAMVGLTDMRERVYKRMQENVTGLYSRTHPTWHKDGFWFYRALLAKS